MPFLPFFCFVCVAGGLCVCVVEYLCAVDSLSDVCTQSVEHSRKKASTTHKYSATHTQNRRPHTKKLIPQFFLLKKEMSGMLTDFGSTELT